jgi:hypothetical protein
MKYHTNITKLFKKSYINYRSLNMISFDKTLNVMQIIIKEHTFLSLFNIVSLT